MLLYEQYCPGCFIKTKMLFHFLFFFFFFFFFHHKFIVVVLSELTLERSKLPTSPSTTHGEPIVNGKLWLAVQA